MARSKRARRQLNSVEALVDALPERFLTPSLGEDPVRSLSSYVAELLRWLAEQGVRPEAAQTVSVDVMEAIGASPADWYLRAATRPAP
ncbi:hypothetical protein [Amycolatopsis lexingtonensis]|uniref:hypothetical protein n=1 Tax=Amycolatopsis lexingtonensis TaxID=218822 RepID=UPI003F715127